jgi:hypothetical protein
MGARLKVREVHSRWRQGDRTWINPSDFAVDMNTENQSRTIILQQQEIPMNSQPEVLSDVAPSCPEAKAKEADAEQDVSTPEPWPLNTKGPAAAKQPALLDQFYYWFMSRS